MSLSTNKLKRRIKLMKTTVISEKYLWLKIKRAKTKKDWQAILIREKKI